MLTKIVIDKFRGNARNQRCLSVLYLFIQTKRIKNVPLTADKRCITWTRCYLTTACLNLWPNARYSKISWWWIVTESLPNLNALSTGSGTLTVWCPAAPFSINVNYWKTVKLITISKLKVTVFIFCFSTFILLYYHKKTFIYKYNHCKIPSQQNMTLTMYNNNNNNNNNNALFNSVSIKNMVLHLLKIHNNYIKIYKY